MKKIIVLVLLFFQLNFVNQNVYANEYKENDPFIGVFSADSNQTNLKTPLVEAGAAVVIDAISGRVLYEKNAYSKRAMASTTKIMTAIVAIENGNLDDSVTVSKRAAEIWGSTIGLKKGQKYTLRELLFGLMLPSGNDAAIAIAEHIGGSVEAFVGMMNDKALELDAKDTQFKSPHGLDMDGHYSTAYDMAIITRYALNNPVFSSIAGTKRASIPGINLYNTNEMLDAYPGADGVKTGYTGKAGRCLVTSATRDNWRIISVVLNCSTRYKRAQSSKNILDYAFSNYRIYRLITQEEESERVKVIKGNSNDVPVQAVDEISLPLRQDEVESMETQFDLPESINAPVYKGIEVGKIRVLVNGQVIAESALKTVKAVPKKGVIDYIKEIVDSWTKIIKVKD